MESPEPQKAPEGEEEVQSAHIWARAWNVLKRGLRRRPRPSESPTDSPSNGVVEGSESEGVWKIAKAKNLRRAIQALTGERMSPKPKDPGDASA